MEEWRTAVWKNERVAVLKSERVTVLKSERVTVWILKCALGWSYCFDMEEL